MICTRALDAVARRGGTGTPRQTSATLGFFMAPTAYD